MIDLNKEAEEYGNLFQGEYDNIVGYMEGAYMKGATSKYVKQQILQAQIDLCNNILSWANEVNETTYYTNNKLNKFQQELKQLQDE